MSDQFNLFTPTISGDSEDITSSAELESGTTPSTLPDGKTTAKSGPEVVPVSPSARPESRKGMKMTGIYGQYGLVSLKPVSRPLSSASKSHPASLLDQVTKRCSVCSNEKPLSEFRKYVGATPDGHRPLCKVCQRDYEKDWRNRSGEKLRKARWIRSPVARDYARKYRAENRAAYLVAECRRRCAKKGIPFDLDAVQIQARIDAGKCEVSGYALDVSPLTAKHQRRPDSPSLDRKDPKKGYVMSNIRVVCLAVNMAMGTWGEKVFLLIAEEWLRRKK